MKSKTETTTAPEYVLAVAPQQQLLAAIAAVEAERETYLIEANRHLSYLSGKIDALRSLLPAPVAPEPTPDESPDAPPS